MVRLGRRWGTVAVCGRGHGGPVPRCGGSGHHGCCASPVSWRADGSLRPVALRRRGEKGEIAVDLSSVATVITAAGADAVPQFTVILLAIAPITIGLALVALVFRKGVRLFR